MKHFVRIVVTLITFYLLSVNAFAGTVFHGAKSAAMGSAFVAVSDDPSAITHNPAGLTQLDNGTIAYSGFSLDFPQTKFTNTSGQSESTSFQMFLVPDTYVVTDLGTGDFRFGYGAYSPFGIGGRKWSQNGFTKYDSTTSMIGTIAVNPTVAYRILPQLSVAVGADCFFAKMQSRKMLDQSKYHSDDAELIIDGKGFGWGYNIGVMITPVEKFKIGLAYRSRVSINNGGNLKIQYISPMLSGTFGGYEYNSGIYLPVTFPDVITAGIAFDPIDKLTIAVDIEGVRWSSFKEYNLTVKDQVSAAGVTSNVTKLDWKDVWIPKVGFEYRATQRLALRAGWTFIKSAIPDKSLDPGDPEGDMHTVSIGFGYKFDKLWVDAAFTEGIYKNRVVNNSILSGKYANSFQVVGLNIGYKF